MGMDEGKKWIEGGKAYLGIELGSTRIKAVLVGPDCAAIASGDCSSGARRTCAGVGSPSAIQTRLVITLSIAIAEAITPEPV